MRRRVKGQRGRLGFTMLELLISMVVLSIVLAGTTVTLLRVQQQYSTQRSTVEAREQARFLELMIANVFRTSGANPKRIAPRSNVAMVVNPLGRSGAIWNNVDLRADFNPVDSLLDGDMETVRIELTSDTVFMRSKLGGDLEPLAYPVSELRFQFYTLDGTEITDAAAAATTSRRVRVTIGIPVKGSPTIVRRESWIALRN